MWDSRYEGWYGRWVLQPPQHVPPGYEVSFACNSNETLCGVEAEAVYEVCVNDGHPNGHLRINLGVPAIGRNSAKVDAPLTAAEEGSRCLW